jgi:DNA-binding response OmpR family regulator
MTQRTVLVVTPDGSERTSLTAALGAQGYDALTATSFNEGRRALGEWHPDVLVTAVRLQEHNGIHLAIVSRVASALTKTIVIGYGDPVLEAEARHAGAQYLVDPLPGDVLAAVDAAIHRRERKWPRARTNITALAANQAVRVVDLSYGGFRMELSPGAEISTADVFDLAIGGIRVSALPVWMKQSESERVWCGATVAGSDDANPAWRHFVDGASRCHPATEVS